MSAIILEMAVRVLGQPSEKTSPEGVAAALLLAHVAWNRAVDPRVGDQIGAYRKVLKRLAESNPNFVRELKSPDIEALIQELAELKLALHPTDDRIIYLCGLTERRTVRVEWRRRGIEGVN